MWISTNKSTTDHIFCISSLIDFKISYDSVKRDVLYNACLNATDSTVQVGKHLSDMLPIENGLNQEDTLSPLLFNFAL